MGTGATNSVTDLRAPPPDIRPWLFVPVLYVMQAIPATLAREVSTLVYKDFGVPNARIALWVSLLGLPWMLKLFWAPVVDLNFTRRRWLLAAQAVIVAALAGLAATWHLPVFFPVTLAILFVMGLASATHDIALDGLYLLSLSRQQQAWFVGVQSASFRAGRLLCTGALVFLAGMLQKNGLTIAASWTAVFAAGAVFYGAGAVYARIFVPRPLGDVPAATVSARENRGNLLRTVLVVLVGACVYGILSGGLRLAGHGIWWSLGAGETLVIWRQEPATVWTNFWVLLASAVVAVPLAAATRSSLRGTVMAEAFGSFTRQPRFGAVLAFIFLYRFGEAMVTMIAPLFMRDATAAGGMGLTVSEVGVINGVAGIVGIILGGIAGGAVIGRYGLRRSFWPLVICMHAPNLLYVWAAAIHPPSWCMYGVAFVDQFGYGFGFAGYSVYLMYVAQRGHFRTSHFAIATGLGSLTIVVAGILAGILQSTVGYVWFFVGVCLCTIPGMLTLLFIPLDQAEQS
jgi:PAT family beta-lactamase induction signal transducer AmpG